MDRNKKLKKSIENKIATKKLPVALLGPIENISLALQTSPILVNASIEPEAFSTIVIEGMMLGSIPVVPDEGGPIEVVSNGKDGLIYKARHPDSLARNLKTLILDLELRKKLSSDAKETATKKYHAKRVIAQLETFYQKVLSS